VHQKSVGRLAAKRDQKRSLAPQCDLLESEGINAGAWGPLADGRGRQMALGLGWLVGRIFSDDAGLESLTTRDPSDRDGWP
jgi:hypothetical protein